MKIFGNVKEQEEIQLIGEVSQEDDGKRIARFKSGNLNIVVTANKPSLEAINRTGLIIHAIAVEHIEKNNDVR